MFGTLHVPPKVGQNGPYDPAAAPIRCSVSEPVFVIVTSAYVQLAPGQAGPTGVGGNDSAAGEIVMLMERPPDPAYVHSILHPGQRPRLSAVWRTLLVDLYCRGRTPERTWPRGRTQYH